MFGLILQGVIPSLDGLKDWFIPFPEFGVSDLYFPYGVPSSLRDFLSGSV